MEVVGEAQEVEHNPRREGSFLLGSPTFEDIGNGRLRCVETGHDLPSKDADAYGKSKGCRLALIDFAVASKKPPLNTFKPDPLIKSKLFCKLTGDTINKTEEHIWKHITGRKFLNKLKQKEEGKPSTMVEKNRKGMATIPSSGNKVKKGNKNTDGHLDGEIVSDGCALGEKEHMTGDDSEEPDFWMPPIGDRWDLDDGKDRWTLCSSSDDASEEACENDCTADLSARTKRLSMAVGPSSFASRKKKSRKNEDDDLSNDT